MAEGAERIPNPSSVKNSALSCNSTMINGLFALHEKTEFPAKSKVIVLYNIC